MNKIKTLKDFTQFWVDIDGTVKCGMHAVPGAAAAIERMREQGQVTFVTNVTTESPKTFVEELRGYGINCTPEEIYTAGSAAIDWLLENKYQGARLVVDGVEKYKEQLSEAGFKNVQKNADLAVVAFNREGNRLVIDEWAFDAIKKGTPFIATHDNNDVPVRQTEDGVDYMCDTGTYLAGLKAAHGKEPLVICGKPYEQMFKGLKYHLKLQDDIDPGKIAMVGDGSSDMLFAKKNSLAAVFVKTGGMTVEDMIKKGCTPDIVWESIANF